MQGATINKMSCAKIKKDLARPDPRLVGCVCAGKMWVAYLGIEANSGKACPYSSSFPRKVGLVQALVPRPFQLPNCAWEDRGLF